MLTSTQAQPEFASPEAVALEARRKGVGALVIGGDHPSLAIARSLGRLGIRVWMLEDQHSIASYSRFVERVIRTSDVRNQEKTVHAVLDVASHFGLEGWVLFPTRDENVAAFSRYRDLLNRAFRVTTPPWDAVQWAWDKHKTYSLAADLGIPCPKTWTIQSAEELGDLNQFLPLAVKPAIKENFFYATGAKAWRANTPQELRTLFAKAFRHISAKEVLIQEIIPGDGDRQLSYCAFFKNGRAHSTLIAKRLRQYPREFGRAASYVETASIPEVQNLSERFLRAINYYGLVEVEFKQDPRDHAYKLLDVNARAWGFHGLGRAVDVDFPLILFADQLGMELEPRIAPPHVGWMRILTDVPVAANALLRRQLSPTAYLSSLRRTQVESVFCAQDPVPFMAEAFLLPFLVLKKHSKRGADRAMAAKLQFKPKKH